MKDQIILLFTGGAIGLISSLVTMILNAYLTDRREMRKQNEQDKRDRAKRFIADGDTIAKYGDKLLNIKSFPPGTVKGCFSGGSLVLMKDATLAKVSVLSVGDELCVFDETGETISSRVISAINKIEVRLTKSIQGMKCVSSDQSVLTPNGLIPMSKIDLGDEIIKDDRSLLQVTDVRYILKSEMLFAVHMESPSIISVDGVLFGDHLKKNMPSVD